MIVEWLEDGTENTTETKEKEETGTSTYIRSSKTGSSKKDEQDERRNLLRWVCVLVDIENGLIY